MTIKELSEITGLSTRMLSNMKNGNKQRKKLPFFTSDDWEFKIVNGRNRIEFKTSALDKIKALK